MQQIGVARTNVLLKLASLNYGTARGAPPLEECNLVPGLNVKSGSWDERVFFLEGADEDYGYGKVFAGRHHDNKITLDVNLWTKIALSYTPITLSVRQFKTDEDSVKLSILGKYLSVFKKFFVIIEISYFSGDTLTQGFILNLAIRVFQVRFTVITIKSYLLVADDCSFATLAKLVVARLQIVGSASLQAYCEHGIDSVTFAADLTAQVVEDGPRFIINTTEKPTPLAYVDTIYDKVGLTDQGISRQSHFSNSCDTNNKNKC